MLRPFPLLLRCGGAFAVVVALLLSGCAMFAPPRAYTSEAEVLADRGQPTRRHDNGDGTVTLEYATQPNGISCLMVEIDKGGIVLRQWDALAHDNLARVEKGMSTAQVDRLLGEHRSEQRFRLSGEVVWDWNIRNDGPGIATLFNVHFIDGKVVRTSQTYIFPRDGGMFGPWGAYGHPYGYPYGHAFYQRSWPGWYAPFPPWFYR